MLKSAVESTKEPQQAEEEAPAWDIPAFTVVDDEEVNDAILDMAGKRDFQPTFVEIPCLCF